MRLWAAVERVDCRLKTEGGILIYLRQEGRGIGLHTKIAAYRLREDGVDTYTANEMLGHAADERSFSAATEFLKVNGVDSVRLISNNPRKRSALEHHGIRVVDVIGAEPYRNPINNDYLSAKVQRESHALSIRAEESRLRAHRTEVAPEVFSTDNKDEGSDI